MKQSIVITAGGTGGHIFPALALAKQAKLDGFSVHWIGTIQGMEASIVTQAGFDFTGLAMKGLRGKSWLERVKTPWRSIKALYQARQLLKQLTPDLVVAFGGYVTGPVGLAAWLQRIPLVLHEQNAYMGLTNRCLRHVAKRVCLAFPLKHTHTKTVITGNPIREALIAPLTKPTKTDTKHHLLVLGGSQGAQAINELVPQALALMEPMVQPIVWHQAGKHKTEATEALYQKHQLSATVNTFIDDMAAAYAWADVVIARAGAMTVSELACVGVPSVLIPLPTAVDDHQTANANYLVSQGAAWLLPQHEANPRQLADWLIGVIHEPQRLTHMAKQARLAAKPLATEQLWQVCRGVISENSTTHSVTES